MHTDKTSAVAEASMSTRRAMDEVERLGVILNAWSDLDGTLTRLCLLSLISFQGKERKKRPMPSSKVDQ